jgi:8-oxo-dGTP pyrophosphatase MutT (NUDIX family)
MSTDASNARDSRLTVVRSQGRARQPSARFVRLSQLRKLRECEQVAAVCYRVRSDGIEFLLVRTRGSGRWTFPKGSTEPGLTHAQAAALEAFEEAGVHGRIEEASFAQYFRKRDSARKSAARTGEKAVNAYLCEVSRLSPPPESNRNRTWFSAGEARQRLQEGRKRDDGAELARVVDRAVERIQQLRGGSDTGARLQENRPQEARPRPDGLPKDALQKVQFDFAEAYGRVEEASFVPYIRRRLRETRQSSGPIADVQSREVLQGAVLEFGLSREKKARALGTGTSLRG